MCLLALNNLPATILAWHESCIVERGMLPPNGCALLSMSLKRDLLDVQMDSALVLVAVDGCNGVMQSKHSAYIRAGPATPLKSWYLPDPFPHSPLLACPVVYSFLSAARGLAIASSWCEDAVSAC